MAMGAMSKGLACPPPFTEQDLQLAEDITILDFFQGLDDLAPQHSLSHNYTKKDDIVPLQKHGIGKQMALVVQFYKPTPTNTNTTTDNDHNSGSKKIVSQLKFDSAKRKLHDSYEQIATEKKRRRTQLISLSELPTVPPLNGSERRCRGRGRGRGRGRVAPTFNRSNLAACH